MRAFTASPAALLAAVLVLLAGTARGQLYKAIYECTTADYTTCDTELKNCLNFVSQYVRDANPRAPTCNVCYTSAYLCYRDCSRFPPGFGKQCSDACAPEYASACSPPEYTGPTAGASAAGVALAALASVLGVALQLAGGGLLGA